MKYKIISYNPQGGTLNVRIGNDSDDINKAQLFSISLAGLSTVSDLNKTISSVFSSAQAALTAGSGVPSAITSYVTQQTGAVVSLSTGVTGVAQSSHSTAANSGSATSVKVL